MAGDLASRQKVNENIASVLISQLAPLALGFCMMIFYLVMMIRYSLLLTAAGVCSVVINLLGTCVFRLVWIAWLDTSRFGVEWVYISYPISWVLILLALVPFWFHLRHKERRARLAAAQQPISSEGSGAL